MPKLSWKYQKIMSIYKRDEKTKNFIIGQYSTPEIEYLKNNIWELTEKVDGTNIRVKYNGQEAIYAGRSDEAHLPVSLIYKLDEIFKSEEGRKRLKETFDYATEEMEVYLYGEGYGAKIQKGGGNYIKDGVDFVLFDVIVGHWQLERSNVDDIARKLNIKSVPVIGKGILNDAIEMVKEGFKSDWGNFTAEGIVARPPVELFTKKGDRVITKVKYADFHKSVREKQNEIIKDKRKFVAARF